MYGEDYDDDVTNNGTNLLLQYENDKEDFTSSDHLISLPLEFEGGEARFFPRRR